jgi:hypothetical protein
MEIVAVIGEARETLSRRITEGADRQLLLTAMLRDEMLLRRHARGVVDPSWPGKATATFARDGVVFETIETSFCIGQPQWQGLTER